MPHASRSHRRRALPRAGAVGVLDDYLEVSAGALHSLAIILPLLIAYEIGTSLYLGSAAGGIETIRAHSILLAFFADFGIAGRFVPAAALVVSLLALHLFKRERWRLRPGYLPVMVIEGALWTLPLLVGGQVLGRLLGSGGSDAAAGAGALAAGLEQLSVPARLTLSIGAGLYEEMLFRMVGIALVHAALVDVVGVRPSHGQIGAIAITGATFAAYHDLAVGSAGVEWARVAFYFGAGIFFGAVYLARGPGIAVLVHAVYDALVLVVLRGG